MYYYVFLIPRNLHVRGLSISIKLELEQVEYGLIWIKVYRNRVCKYIEYIESFLYYLCE